MPSGTINCTTVSTNDITAKITWSESNVNIANNTSDITVNLIYHKLDSLYATSGSGYFTVTINGTDYSDNHYVYWEYAGDYTALTKTVTIPHNADGSKSVSISVKSGYIPYPTTGLQSTTGSGTATLTTIARASQPTCPSTCTFGSTIKVTTNRASSSFTHTLSFTIGSHVTQVTGVGADYTWTIPAAWADAIPAASSTTLSIACATFNGSTNIGTKTCSSTVSIPSSWAAAASISVSRGGTVGDNNVILKGLTTVTLTCAGTATTGSTISSYKWSGGSTATTASITPSTAAVGSTTYTCTVTDRRGKTASSSYTVTVVDPASTFTCADSVAFGSALAVTISRKKSTFTHTVRYRINTTYTTDQTGKTTSDSFTVPSSWAASVPSSTSVTMAVTVYTYNGSTNVGTTSKNVSVTVPSGWVPSVSISTSYADRGANNEIISLVTTATLTASATPSTGTTISSYSWSGGAVSGTGASKTHKAGAPGTYTYTVTATDSRGRTGSKSVTITFVDGTSSFTVPTAVDFGSALAVSITRMKASFTHTVKYEISSSYTKSTTGVGTSDSYTIPTSWAASVPNASSINLTVTVTTYSGSTSLGGSIKRVTVNVPSSWVPTIGSISATPIDGFNGLYLKGVSKATIAVSSGAPSTGATIASYKYAGNNISGTNSSTSTSNSKNTDILATIGTNTYTVTITDSRGRTGTKQISIEVLNYSKPSIRETVGRYTSGGVADNFGDHGRITIAGSYTNVTGNTWTITAKYKKRLYSTYTTVNTWTDQTGAIALNSDLFVADVDSAYDCWVTIEDAVGFSAEAHTTMSTGRAVMDYYKDRVIGIFSTASETLRQEMGNPETLLFSNAEKNYLNGEIYIPMYKHTNGREGSWARLNDLFTHHYVYVNGGVSGYAKVCRITIKGTYLNSPIAITYIRRGSVDLTPTTIYIKYVNANTSDPELLSFVYDGYSQSAYIVKAATSTWDIYIQKAENYDGIDVVDCKTSKQISVHSGIEIEWLSEFATALPSGYRPATRIALHPSTIDATSTVQTSDGFIGQFVELKGMGSSSNHGGYIDFHFNNSTADYTSRFIEVSSGVINVDSTVGANALQVARNRVWNLGNSLSHINSAQTSTSCASGSTTTVATYTPGADGYYLITFDTQLSAANSNWMHSIIDVQNSSGTSQMYRAVKWQGTAGGGGGFIAAICSLQSTYKILFRVYNSAGSAVTATWRGSYIRLRTG